MISRVHITGDDTACVLPLEGVRVVALEQAVAGPLCTRHLIVSYGPYRCSDGEVMLGVQNEGQWERLWRVVLRRPALADDPRFATNELRVRARESLEPLIREEVRG